MSANDDFDIKNMVLNLSANLEQPDKFAEIFCKAAEKQKSIDAVLKNIVREVLKYDNDTLEHIKIVQRQVNNEDWRSFIKRIGIAGWSISMLVIGAIITGLSRKYFG